MQLDMDCIRTVKIWESRMAAKISRLSVQINMDIEKGSTFRHRFIWTYAEDPQNPIDLTGCTARMQIRPSQESDAIYQDLTTENGGITLGGTSGTIDLYISDVDSTAWTWNTGVYGLEIAFPNTDVRRLCRGTVVAYDETTR